MQYEHTLVRADSWKFSEFVSVTLKRGVHLWVISIKTPLPYPISSERATPSRSHTQRAAAVQDTPTPDASSKAHTQSLVWLVDSVNGVGCNPTDVLIGLLDLIWCLWNTSSVWVCEVLVLSGETGRRAKVSGAKSPKNKKTREVETDSLIWYFLYGGVPHGQSTLAQFSGRKNQRPDVLDKDWYITFQLLKHLKNRGLLENTTV